MASDRDTLAALIEAQGYELDRGPHVAEWPEDEREFHRRPEWPSFIFRAMAMQAYRRASLADAVIAAGWRPPAPVVTNAELEALPSGAVVMRDGRAWQREHDVWWLGGVASAATGPFGAGAITVLYDPTEEPADEQ